MIRVVGGYSLLQSYGNYSPVTSVIPSHLQQNFVPWAWELDDDFDHAVTHAALQPLKLFSGWTLKETLSRLVGEVSPNTALAQAVKRVELGEVIGNISLLTFRDPNTLRAGALFHASLP